MELFKVVMLSSWNSISGPKIEHVWLPDNHPIFHSCKDVKINVKGYDIPRSCILPLNFSCIKNSKQRKQKNTQNKGESAGKSSVLTNIEHTNATLLDIRKCLSMSGKLLITEIESRKGYSENCSRLYCLENEILFSVIFHQRPWLDRKTNVESHCSCISVLISSETFSLTYDVHRIIDLHLRKVVSVMQRSLASPSSVAKEVSYMIEEICQVIHALTCTSGSAKDMELSPHLFQQFQHEMKFLSRAIASHIQTCGYSVVNGDSSYSINQIAKILLLFNNEQERQCSEANIRAPQNTYHSGLHVQAILKERNDSFLPGVVYRDCPVSFIDTDWWKVRQTLSDSLPECNSNLLKTVTESGTLIPQLLDDLIFFEENNSDVRSLVRNFCKFLVVKAMALMKIIDEYRAEGRTPTEKKLIVLLNVKDVADLHLCIGFAEKLKPGIRTAIS